LFDVCASVSYCNLARYDVSQVRQSSTKPLLVGIQDPAQHQFTSRIYQLDDQARKFRVESFTLQVRVLRPGLANLPGAR
jgi:hypothetical protein